MTEKNTEKISLFVFLKINGIFGALMGTLLWPRKVWNISFSYNKWKYIMWFRSHICFRCFGRSFPFRKFSGFVSFRCLGDFGSYQRKYLLRTVARVLAKTNKVKILNVKSPPKTLQPLILKLQKSFLFPLHTFLTRIRLLGIFYLMNFPPM